MNSLYMLVTITNRNLASRYQAFYKKNGINFSLISMGRGTANSEVLDFIGLEATEKAIILGVVTEQVWKTLKKGLEHELQIDIPGVGIVFTIPFSSIGGRRELSFLTQNQDFEKGEETTLKDTTHELIIVISNQGYNELVMDAARDAGAAGGTVIHAKGSGMQHAEKFLGVSLAAEKEITFIVTKTNIKNDIMKAIMQHAGMESKAKSIVFSLPVTSTAGLRLLE